MSGLANWRSNILSQQQQLAQQQLAQQQLAQKQLIQQQLAAQEKLAQQQKIAQEQLAKKQQEELQEKYDSLATQLINIANSTVNVNGSTHITCQNVTVTGGNNQITTTGPIDASGTLAGYYCRTDSGQNPTTIPAGLTTVIVFSGQSDPSAAVTNSAIPSVSPVPSTLFITLGGATYPGYWSNQTITNVKAAAVNNIFSAYTGIVFDIEDINGDAPTSYPAPGDFEPMFAAAKTAGLTVIVTVSHTGGNYSDMATAVYQPIDYMNAFFASTNIDYLSPQLYGDPPAAGLLNDYTPSNGWSGPTVPWSAWQNCKAKVAPSILDASYYKEAVAVFNTINNPTANTPQLTQPIVLSGFIQWNQSQ